MAKRLTSDTVAEERPAGSRLEGWATPRVLGTDLFRDFLCGPSFETRPSGAPQDEDIVCNTGKVSAYERATPVALIFMRTGEGT